MEEPIDYVFKNVEYGHEVTIRTTPKMVELMEYMRSNINSEDKLMWIYGALCEFNLIDTTEEFNKKYLYIPIYGNEHKALLAIQGRNLDIGINWIQNMLTEEPPQTPSETIQILLKKARMVKCIL